MSISRRAWLELAFWVVVTLVFLYERRYLAQKIGLGHFVECVVVRLFLIITLAYWNLYVLIPLFLRSRQYVVYGALLTMSLVAYILLQSWYDRYLYGFVIGLERDRHLWNVVPYNAVVTAWYVGLTLAFKRALDWYVQSEELTKLYEENKILKTQAAVQNGSLEEPPGYIWLKTGTQKRKVALTDIVYIQGLKDYSIIFTKDDKIVVRGNLKQVEQQFPNGKLLRVHKSYLVDFQKIVKIRKNKVVLGKVELPIGRNYKEQVVKFFAPTAV